VLSDFALNIFLFFEAAMLKAAQLDMRNNSGGRGKYLWTAFASVFNPPRKGGGVGGGTGGVTPLEMEIGIFCGRIGGYVLRIGLVGRYGGDMARINGWPEEMFESLGHQFLI